MYDIYNRKEPSKIYIAKPGKQLLGCLNGVDESSCSLDIKFIDANELSFDVYKYRDGEETAYYDYIDVMMELFVDNYGWYIIDETPALHNDGILEYLSITAKSYEYTLHNYDLSTFDVNTASSTSREMLATDNVYTYFVTPTVWYNLFRDNVLFWRDSSQHDAILEQMNEQTTYSQLKNLLVNYPKVLQSDWRISVPIDSSLRSAFSSMYSSTGSRIWQDWITAYDNNQGVTSDTVKTLAVLYPQLISYLTLEFDMYEYEFDDEFRYIKTENTLSAYELMKMETQRIKDLSLLDLVISDIPGWEIGEVDRNLYAEHVDINGVQIPLQDEVGRFEVDAQDVYSFLVTELSGYFECIFQFDTINNKINAYRIESLGIDTKIFLGFRNVQNSVEVTSAQELFTQFTVENSEGLGITYVNFGERNIEDISYFLNTKYLPEDLIIKYQSWLEFRESKRADYIQLSRDYNAKHVEGQELYNRVPADMLNISQLDSYSSQDQLREIIDNYYALIIGMLQSFIYVSSEGVTPPDKYDTYQNYTDYITAMDNYIDQLYNLIDQNKDSMAIAFKDSLYYSDYVMMREFTIPNLVVTYTNLELPSYETPQDYYDSFEYNFDDDPQKGYGWMYGINELKNYQQSHTDKMEIYKTYATAWEDIPDTEEGIAFKDKYTETEYTANHEIYQKYLNGYNSATAALERRQAEYDVIMNELDVIDGQRQELAESVNKEGYFTKPEIIRISRLLKHTDYCNDNIQYLSNLDNTDTTIDKQQEMYNEAIDELFVESHPQYVYTTSVDDLLVNNEYELFNADFNVGNFIRIGLDDETQVKLRLIGIQFNPMIYDKDLTLTYSNMVRYRQKRNDFVNLVNSALKSTKNSITARYERTSDADNTLQVTYDLVQKILQSSAFTNYTQNVQAGAVGAVAATFSSLAAGYIKTDELDAAVANITELHADSAFMKYLEANLVVASEIDVDDLKVKMAEIDTLAAGSAFVNYLQSISSTTATSVINDAYIYDAVANKITVADLAAGDIVLTNTMRIISQNENGGNVLFNGSTMQFTNGDGDVGIQIGYGEQSFPHIVITDENGTSLWTSTGITADAIADNLIVNNMISNGTISKSKLNFPIIEANEYGGVDIMQIYDGSGGKFGVEYVSFKTTTNETLAALDEKIDDSAAYTLYIDCPNGTNIKGQSVTLNAILFKNSVNVTDEFDDSCFKWTRQSSDNYGDIYWNDNHTTGTKTITVTANDVRINADFKCVFEYGDTTVTSE